MSRHRLIRNLHLNDELDDFDGMADDDYDFDDAEGNCPSSLISLNLICEPELSEEDHEKLRNGTLAVRASLPPCKSYITNKEIQESLWYTYYNVEKTVEYLLRIHSDKPKAGKMPKVKSTKGPSPDDIVLAAQSKASGAKKVQPKSKKEGPPDEIVKKFESTTIDDARPQLKKLDVPKEFRNQIRKNTANFVVIGHVDAGKSTLMGRLLLDLGVVEQRTVDRYRKEADSIGKSSFAIAWVFDQGSEERARGVTIDISMNKFETSNTSFTVLDAPGHRDFIPNMIAGASQADFVVLVIDASTGSFESGLKGQTREHTLLVRSMGVQRIIVAINKLDTVAWSEERFTEIKNQISSFLTTSGFHAKNISIVPCSGLLGDNVINRSQNPASTWYNGQTLIEALDDSGPVSRNLDEPLRMMVFDVFRGGQQNPVSINGRIDSGTLQVGELLLAQPSGQTCIVKALEFDSQTVDWAVSGQIITIHLSGIADQYLKAGDVLCTTSSPIQNIKEFTAKILAFEFILPMQVEIHKGRLHTTGRVKKIECILSKTTGAVVGKPPRVIKPGMLARVSIEVDLAVPLEPPGRVVLRSDGCTIAAGLIE